MKRGKASDDNGIFAELLRDGTETLRGMILDVFNDILCLKEYPPDDWKVARLSVIFKKGDPALPENYRPISILPILYKLFSRMLCERLSSILMPLQAADQAAYRKGFSTDDHTFVAYLVCAHRLLQGVRLSRACDALEGARRPGSALLLYFASTAFVFCSGSVRTN